MQCICFSALTHSHSYLHAPDLLYLHTKYTTCTMTCFKMTGGSKLIYYYNNDEEGTGVDDDT